MTMRKNIILAMIFIAMTSFYLTGCKFVKGASKPSASVKFKNIKRISLIKQSITLGMELDIYNPWPISGSVKYVKMKFYIGKKRLTKIKFKNPKILASKTAHNPFTLKLRLKDINRIYKDLKKRDKIKYTVKGRVGINVPGYGVFSLPFTHRGTLPAIKIKLSVKNFKVGKFKISMNQSAKNLPGISLGGIGKMIKRGKPKFTVDVFFDFHLKNKTKAILKFANLKADFFLGGHQIMTSGTGTAISSKNNRFVYRVKNSVSLNGTLRALFSKNRSKYKLKGSIILKLPAPFGDVPVIFSKRGRLRW